MVIGLKQVKSAKYQPSTHVLYEKSLLVTSAAGRPKISTFGMFVNTVLLRINALPRKNASLE